MRNVLNVVIPLAFLACMLPPQTSHAQDQPVQLALFNPIQIVPEQQSIAGIRINLIYGKNTSVTGLDFGLVNHTTAGKSQGVQFGFIGFNEGDFVGWMDNTANISKGACEGVQFGFVNYARSMNGLQFGLVNYAASMKGLQIGLVNIIEHGGAFPVLPIVNWSF